MEIDKIAYIEIREGKILCTKSFGKNTYYIPGGKRDPGETDEETLVREVKEELDVAIRPTTIEFVGIFKAQAHGKAEGVKVKMSCYKAEFEGTLKPSNEIEEIRWLTMADIDLVSYVDVKIFNYLHEKGELT
ncbi:MAG: NUDIX domain-containing protein [Bacteroidota bacterium]